MNSLRTRTWSVLAVSIALAACSGAESAADVGETIVGKWKRADNREIVEFAEDGSLTRLVTIRDRQISFGGTYAQPAEDRLQLTVGPDGPANFGYRMLGDSMYLTGLEGAPVKYYRDRGDQPSVTYVLRTVDGQAVPRLHETPIRISPGATMTEKTEYREGSLVLDPLTRTFVATLTIAQPGWSGGGPHPEKMEGTYTTTGDSLALRVASPAGAPPLPGKVEGETLAHRGYVHIPSAPDGQEFRPGPVLGYVRQ